MSDEATQNRLHPAKASMGTFPVDQVLDNSSTDFDLYVEAGGQLTLYAKEPYKWSKDELARLLTDGHQTLFYFTSDQAKVDTYRLVHHSVRLPPELGAPLIASWD